MTVKAYTWCFYVFGFLLISSCQEPEYPGYTKLRGSVHYKLLALGDEDKPVGEDNFTSFCIHVKSREDSLVAIKDFSRLNLGKPAIPKNLQEILLMTHLDDSLEVIGTVKDLGLEELLKPLAFKSDTGMRLFLKISEVLSDDELRQIRAEERLLSDAEMAEQRALQRLRDSVQAEHFSYIDGMYYKSVVEGKGKRPESGAQVIVHYKASFLDGTYFDDTFSGQPLEYEVGRPDQVLEGFATGIAQMKKGGEAVFIIPSEVGFGNKGSSTGIVPPFTTLVYNVKLLEVHI